MITTFHLSRTDLAATNSELYWQTLAEHNYSTGTIANQLIRVFLKFNFMALQHQDKQSLMLLWVNELYPLCLQLLNSLVEVIECYTFNLSQGPSFAMGCNSPWSLEHASALTRLNPGPAAPFAGRRAPPPLGTHQAPASLSCRVHRREQNQTDGCFTSILNTSKTSHCSPGAGVRQFSRQLSGLGFGRRFNPQTVKPRCTNPADPCAPLSIPRYWLLGCFVKHFKVLWQKRAI